jgi:hypothetical protein
MSFRPAKDNDNPPLTLLLSVAGEEEKGFLAPRGEGHGEGGELKNTTVFVPIGISLLIRGGCLCERIIRTVKDRSI